MEGLVNRRSRTTSTSIGRLCDAIVTVFAAQEPIDNFYPCHSWIYAYRPDSTGNFQVHHRTSAQASFTHSEAGRQGLPNRISYVSEQTHKGEVTNVAGRTAGRRIFDFARLERRWFVFVLLPLAANDPFFQKTLGQISAPQAECDCQAQHQSPEGNSEGNQHGLFCDTQFFKDDREYEDNDDAANGQA